MIWSKKVFVWCLNNIGFQGAFWGKEKFSFLNISILFSKICLVSGAYKTKIVPNRYTIKEKMICENNDEKKDTYHRKYKISVAL